MFFNPADLDTINAMASYREEQVYRALDHVSEGDRTVIVIRRTSSPGPVRSIREVIGLALMRAGARLAGYGLRTRIGTQS